MQIFWSIKDATISGSQVRVLSPSFDSQRNQGVTFFPFTFVVYFSPSNLFFCDLLPSSKKNNVKFALHSSQHFRLVSN